MEKFALYKKNLPFVLLTLVVGKFLIFPYYVDALVILGLAAMAAYYHHLEDSKAEAPDAEVKRALATVQEDMKNHRDQINALKISNAYRR